MTNYRERYNGDGHAPPPPPLRATGGQQGVVAYSSRSGHAFTGAEDALSNGPRMRSSSDSTGNSASGSGTAIAMAVAVKPAFVNACREGDDNRLRQLMTSRTLTPEMINCTDKTGKTGVNLICANGNLSLLQLISTIPSLDINLGDNEANTPLHFASQAGHVETLHFLLNEFKNLQIDARNNLGFTALMKASLQGRVKCVKLLLAAGASPVLRDYGRGFCAYEWARYCTRQPCAEVIEKFMKSCNYSPGTLRKQLKDLEKWNSEPNLQFFTAATDTKNGWLKQKLKKALFNKQSGGSGVNPETTKRAQSDNYSVLANLTNAALCASSPVVPTASSIKTVNSVAINNNNSLNGDATRPVPKVQITEFNANSTAFASSKPLRSYSYS